jgi:hypothetical protein
MPADLLRLRDQIDASVAAFSHGPRGSRPTAGVAGRLHFATDVGELAYDDGRTWQVTTPMPEAPHHVGRAGEPSIDTEWISAVEAPLRFWKVEDQVRLTGRVQARTPSDATVAGELFVLPPGYRPTGSFWWPVAIFPGSIGVVILVRDGRVLILGTEMHHLLLDINFIGW